MRGVVTVTVSAAASAPASRWIPLNLYNEPFDASFGLVLATAAASGRTWKVQHMFDDVQDPSVTPTAFDHSTVSAAAANVDGSYTEGVVAVRLAMAGSAATVSGQSATLTVLQTGY